MVAALAGVAVLAAMPIGLAGSAAGQSGESMSRPVLPVAARLTSSGARRVVAPVPGWERRFIASLPPGLRDRVTAVLTRPASSGCITIAGAAEHGQAWLTGYANVTKLHGAALVSPALADVVALTKEIVCPQSVIELSTEVPDFHGKPEFPPMRATFLAFGFVPVTATIQISQVGTGVVKLTLAGWSLR